MPALLNCWPLPCHQTASITALQHHKRTLISCFTTSLLLSALLLAPDSYATSTAEAIARPAKILRIEDPDTESLRSFPAKVKARSRTELTFRVPGQLMELHAREGETVTQDQLLARLDPADYQVILQQRQAEHELARQQYKRFNSMVQRKLISPAQFDQAKAELAVAQAALSRAKLDLKYTYLKAPYQGVISQRLVENFQNLQAQETVLILQSDSTFDIDFQLPETIFALKPRQAPEQARAKVYFDSNPEQAFTAWYRERNTEADAATGAYTVTLSMEKPADFPVYPGMTARVEFDMSQVFDIGPAHIYLPVEAVFSAENHASNHTTQQIWKVNPQTMRVYQADVTVGSLSTRGIEIIDGVSPGDQIITAGVHYLKEGMQVRPWIRERGL